MPGYARRPAWACLETQRLTPASARTFAIEGSCSVVTSFTALLIGRERYRIALCYRACVCFPGYLAPHCLSPLFQRRVGLPTIFSSPSGRGSQTPSSDCTSSHNSHSLNVNLVSFDSPFYLPVAVRITHYAPLFDTLDSGEVIAPGPVVYQ